MVKSVSLKVPVYLLIVSCCDITDVTGQGVSQVSDEDLSQRKVLNTQGKTRPLVGINYRDKMRFAFSLSFPCISVCRTEKTLKNKRRNLDYLVTTLLQILRIDLVSSKLKFSVMLKISNSACSVRGTKNSCFSLQ